MQMQAGRSIPAWAGETPRFAAAPAQWQVYPRVGGGNTIPVALPYAEAGLSPRGRGKRPQQIIVGIDQRSIPAWAGETALPEGWVYLDQVYPRVGGGNGSANPKHSNLPGLSPRGRGKPCSFTLPFPMSGSIPAWAGETKGKERNRYANAVYPRVGGGNPSGICQRLAMGGLSPRGRGKPALAGRARRGHRSIPAWAGETGGRPAGPPPPAVYPRVGGGNDQFGTTDGADGGLSPRGRGKRPAQRYHRQPPGSIPAWAGETLLGSGNAGQGGVYPRVGGGNLARVARVKAGKGLSPRGRGKRMQEAEPLARPRSIPAWAGETEVRDTHRSASAVYPRVGGGN